MTLPTEHAAIIVAGLGYGDESKGATVDALAAHIPDTTAVVRWSGGAQAAHNVVHGPRHHTFRQFGSASFLGVQTFLMAPMLFDPLMLLTESGQLEGLGVANALGLVTVDERCLVTTPIHRALNRARELARGTGRHGSCGLGIGETAAYDLACKSRAREGDTVGNFVAPNSVAPGARALTAFDLRFRAHLRRGLDEFAAYAAPLLAQVDDPDGLLDFGSIDQMASDLHDISAAITQSPCVRGLGAAMDAGTVIFEGSQGVLLDQDYGFHPHTTWSTTSPRDLRRKLAADGRNPYVLGLTRSYATRHGAGPMPTENAAVQVPEPHNGTGIFQGGWRQGHLDLAALRYAVLASGGVDGISVSHLDEMQDTIVTSWGWENDVALYARAADPLSERRTAIAERARPEYADCAGQDDLLDSIRRATGAPVVVTSNGPARAHRKFSELATTAQEAAA
jgi:adenylosuccinate synthase